MRELGHPDFRTAIAAFFNRLLDRFDDPAVPRGCLITMTATELGDRGAILVIDVSAIVGDVIRRREAA